MRDRPASEYIWLGAAAVERLPLPDPGIGLCHARSPASRLMLTTEPCLGDGKTR